MGNFIVQTGFSALAPLLCRRGGGRKIWPLNNRPLRLAAAFALCCYSAPAAQAAENATWAGTIISAQWEIPTNWGKTGSIFGGVPSNTATFGSGGWATVGIALGYQAQIKTMSFTKDAKAFTFQIGGILTGASLTVSGQGVVNNSGKQQTFEVGGLLGTGTLCFINGATSADSVIRLNSKGRLCYMNNANAGSSDISVEEDSEVDFSGDSSAGKSHIDLSKGSKASFGDNATAGDSQIKVGDGASVDFGGNSSGGNSAIDVGKDGSINFREGSSAGDSTLNVSDGGKAHFDDKTNAGNSNIGVGDGGTVDFNDDSNAGNSDIDVGNGGKVDFNDDSSAGDSNIGVGDGGEVDFNDGSNAGNSDIDVDKGGKVGFNDDSSAGDSDIDVGDGGKVDFNDGSNAGNSDIDVGDGGEVDFNDGSNAGNSDIDVGDGGKVDFNDGSNAGNSDIDVGDGGKVDFNDGSNAGNSDIDVGDGGKVDFNDGSNAGNSDIDVGDGGEVDFNDGSNAGNSDIDVGDGGKVGFNDGSNAGNSDIDVGKGGKVDFNDGSSAGDSNIGVGDGGEVDFNDGSNAGNSDIDVGKGGKVGFNDDSSAGNSNIGVGDGGKVDFNDNANGDQSDITIGKGGSVDLGGLTNGGTGVGSIHGDGDIKLGDNRLTIGGNDKDSDFGGDISGTGGIDKIGKGTLLLRGDKDYSGDTQVKDGELRLDGSLKNSDVTVDNGAIVSGDGTVGRLHARDGSSVSPGVKPGNNGRGGNTGSLIVEGDTVFDKGSNLIIKNGNGSNDRIVVHGDADIKGGDVDTRGFLRPGTILKDIISADGKLSGGFDGIVPEYATDFITPRFVRTANGINIEFLRNGTMLDHIGRSRNERKLGAALESLPLSSDLLIHILNSTTDEAQTALKQLSGQIYASTRSAIMQSSNYLAGFMNDRMAAAMEEECCRPGLPRRLAGSGRQRPGRAQLFGYAVPDAGAPGRGRAAIGAAGIMPNGALCVGQGSGELWLRGFSSWQNNTKSSNGAYGHEMATSGSFIGLDSRQGQWLVGGALGLGYSAFDNKALTNYGHMRTIYSGLYGGRRYKGVNIRLGAQQNWYEIHTKREVEFVRYQDSLKSKYHARLTQIFGEAGLPLAVAKNRLEPFARLSYNYLYNGKVREHGGEAALSGAHGSYDYAASLAGLRGHLQLCDREGRRANLYAMLGWQHIYGNTVPTAAMSFGQSQAFDTHGTPMERDNMAVETGMDFYFTGKAAIGVSYNGQYGQKNTDHGVRVTFHSKY